MPEWYKKLAEKVDENTKNYLKNYFGNNSKTQALKDFEEVILYSAQGGKRFRGVLAILFSGEDLENISENVMKFAIAIELFHVYTLCHDDLPCMDNDEYRRGKLTTWKKFGETNAVLCGDLLNSLSFKIISELKSFEILEIFGNAAGFHGVIGGQIEDLFFEKNGNLVTEEILKKLHNKKTGELIKTAILGGIILNKSLEKKDLEFWGEFGLDLGLAFQIKDDLLDATGTFETTGKSVGGEEKGFVSVFGVEKSEEVLNNLLENCSKKVSVFENEKLNWLVEFVGKREK